MGNTEKPRERTEQPKGDIRGPILALLVSAGVISATFAPKGCNSSDDTEFAADDEGSATTDSKSTSNPDGSIATREADPANAIPLKFNNFSRRDELFKQCERIRLERAEEYADELVSDFAGRITAESEKKLREALAMGCDVSGVTSDDIAIGPPAPYDTCFTSVSLEEPILFEGEDGMGKMKLDISADVDVPFMPIMGQLDQDSVLKRCHKEQRKLAKTRAENALADFGIVNESDVSDASYIADQLGCEVEVVETYRARSDFDRPMETRSLIGYRAPAPYDKCEDFWIDFEHKMTEDEAMSWTHPRDRDNVSSETKELMNAVKEGRHDDAFAMLNTDSMRSELENSLSGLDSGKAEELRTVFEGVFEDVDAALQDVNDKDAVCKLMSAFEQISGLEPADQQIIEDQHMMIWFFELAEGYFDDASHCEG